MRWIVLLVVVAFGAGCAQEAPKKPEPYVASPVKEFDPKTDPHLIIWKDGHEGGDVVIEIKNMKWAVDSEIAPFTKDGDTLTFPGKIWWGGRSTGGLHRGHQPFVLCTDDRYVYHVGGPENLSSFYKEDRYKTKK